MFLTEVEREFRAACSEARPDGSKAVPEVFRIRLTARQDGGMAPGSREIEFDLLDQVLQRVLGELEGKRLADLEVFDRRPPSLENLAQFIYRKAEILLERGGGKVDEVRVSSLPKAAGCGIGKPPRNVQRSGSEGDSSPDSDLLGVRVKG